MGDGTIRLKDDDALTEFLRARHVKLHAEARLVKPGERKPTPAPATYKAEKTKEGRLPKPRSDIEARMSQQLHMGGLAEGMMEWPNQLWPIPGRDYRVDFAWPAKKFILEVDGAVHKIKGVFKSSFERSFLLMQADWQVLHVGGDQVRSGEAFEWVKELLCKQP
jgi:very-short-patch-repair endonuclease